MLSIFSSDLSMCFVPYICTCTHLSNEGYIHYTHYSLIFAYLYTGGLADMCDLKRPIPSLAEGACEQVREGKDAFSPSTETVAIHMW